jgi:hypothetical protein
MEVIKTTGRFIHDRPTIELQGKLFPIDDRKSNIDKLQIDIAKPDNSGKEDEVVIKALIGPEGFKAVTEMDLSMKDYQSLIVILQSQVYGISEEEAKKRFLAGL